MIVYQQAYDIYHCVYRLLCLLSYFNRGDSVEIDRLRIWDFYLLYPNRMKDITLKKDEDDIKKIIKQFVLQEENPYEQIPNSRVMFEKIQTYQLCAIKYLASYGIIEIDFNSSQRVKVIDKETLKQKLVSMPLLTEREMSAVKLLTSHFFLMPLFGQNGLKHKTGLLESRYDA